MTTFARKGLTVAADANPLADASLDGEGRCLMTDHGGFVLFAPEGDVERVLIVVERQREPLRDRVGRLLLQV